MALFLVVYLRQRITRKYLHTFFSTKNASKCHESLSQSRPGTPHSGCCTKTTKTAVFCVVTWFFFAQDGPLWCNSQQLPHQEVGASCSSCTALCTRHCNAPSTNLGVSNEEISDRFGSCCCFRRRNGSILRHPVRRGGHIRCLREGQKQRFRPAEQRRFYQPSGLPRRGRSGQRPEG